MNQVPSNKTVRKSIASRQDKIKSRRVRAARQANFQTSDWYQKAAQSIGVSARASHAT